jgi:OmpA-OmpF porin, OOP family
MRIAKLFATLALVLPVMAHAGTWYAGLDVGSAQSEAKIDEYILFGATTARASDTTTGWRVRGGYQFGRFFALEVAYVDFGDVEYHFDPDDCPFGAPGPCPFDVRTSINGFVGTLRGILPIGDHWFLDARLGYGKMKVDTNEIGGASVDASSDNDAFHYGIGGGYRFNERWEILLDYSEYNQEDLGNTLSSDSGSYNLGETSVTSLGVGYRW